MAVNPDPPGKEHSRWLVLIAVGFGSFMSALDGSVVNISLPVIAKHFGASLTEIEWVVTIYLLVLSGVMLTFGRLGDLRGQKRVYLLGFIVFVISSAACGFAQSVTMLIICRAVQALGGAMLASSSPAIITKTFPGTQRGQALGLAATMTYLGLTIGPSLGGFLTNALTWRAVFYINIPVGLIAILMGFLFIKNDNHRSENERFDIPGALVFMLGLISLLLGLNQGPVMGWDSPLVLASLLLAVVLLAFFIRIELRVPSPMLDLSLFKRRVFSLSVVSAILNYLCVYIILFLLPFYLINGRELAPSHAGLILSAQPVIMAIVAPISGYLSDRLGARLPGVIGMTSLAVGLFFLSRLGPTTPLVWVAAALAVVGFGTGTFISPNNNALMGSAPRDRQGISAGVLATSRNFGMILGVGIAGATFNTALASHADPAGKAALFSAFSVAFLVAIVFAVIGAITTGIRDA